MSPKKITIAYSPDTDDAFMVRAMQDGAVDLRGYEFAFTSADIQELNDAATREVYDVTAISVAAYPDLSDRYLMMPVGASVGDEFGPALIVREGSPLRRPSELVEKRIAVPGLKTSAFFAARGVIGAFTAVPMHFTKIGPAVLAGDVDAGILIHELQLDCESKGFVKLGDLGKLWHAATGLPLPLGANAIRRGLGDAVIKDVNEIMRESVEYGLAHREDTLAKALSMSGAAIDAKLGDRYISMYVNERSLKFAQDARAGVQRLFAVGAEAGLCRSLAPDGAWLID